MRARGAGGTRGALGTSEEPEDAATSDIERHEAAPPPDGPLELLGVRAVMVFSVDPARSCAWWAAVLGLAMRSQDGFWWLDTPGGIELGFHPADPDRNPSGASTVPYWRVADLDVALARLEAAGARRHRGPLRVDGGRRIAQVMDPFGVVVGLDGP